MNQKEFVKMVKHRMIDEDKNKTDLAKDIGVGASNLSNFFKGRFPSKKFLAHFGYRK
jgi:DNA-binding Xre family transcriptional regulator